MIITQEERTTNCAALHGKKAMAAGVATASSFSSAASLVVCSALFAGHTARRSHAVGVLSAALNSGGGHLHVTAPVAFRDRAADLETQFYKPARVPAPAPMPAGHAGLAADYTVCVLPTRLQRILLSSATCASQTQWTRSRGAHGRCFPCSPVAVACFASSCNRSCKRDTQSPCILNCCFAAPDRRSCALGTSSQTTCSL